MPHLGAACKELYVFQRTPSSVDERNNRKTTPEFIKEQMTKPGWQKVLFILKMTEFIPEMMDLYIRLMNLMLKMMGFRRSAWITSLI